MKKKPVARLVGLFDNDEDDDELFGSSNYGFGLGSSKPSVNLLRYEQMSLYYVHYYVCNCKEFIVYAVCEGPSEV